MHRALSAAIVAGFWLSLSGPAWADPFMDQVRAELARYAGPQTDWRGPTAAPKPEPGKHIAYLSTDEQNDASREWGQAIAEAAGKIGWTVTIIDGHGTPVGWQQGLNQAIALKVDGIVTNADAASLQEPIREANARKITVVGIHATAFPGPQPELGLFVNIQQDPREIGSAQADWIIANSDGHARVVVTSHCEYAIACAKAHATEARIKDCPGCAVLEFSNSPIAEVAQRQPALVTAWVQKYGTPLYITSVADYTADYQVPALRAGGVDPADAILVSADGNKSAYERIRAGGQYQLVTASEPYKMQGYQAVDELNRAFHGQPPSGFVQTPYLVTPENIHAEGGDRNTFIPSNDYERHYLALWGSVVAASHSAVLTIRGLVKHFGGTRALDGVDLELRAGEVHALLGENGAGKSTLIKCLAGLHAPDAGEIMRPGRLAIIHQDLGLVDSMTVAENMALVAGYARPRLLIDWRRTQDRAAAFLARMGGGVAADARVRDLSVAAKAIVAIARALAVDARVLVLDEPTAALPESDVARLLAVLAGLRADGIALLYVTHRLDEVFRIADRVTVLRDGRVVTSAAVADTSAEQLVAAIVGRAVDPAAPPLTRQQQTMLEVDDLVAHGTGPVRFSLCAGEALGLVGLRGAGQDVVGRVLFGDTKPQAGTVRLQGRTLWSRGPRQAIAAGIALVPGKRQAEALAPALTVRENLFANPAPSGVSPLRPISPRGERSRARAAILRFGVRPTRPGAPDRRAVGRQPAEGRAGAVARRRQPCAGAGGADLRRRRRRQGGDPPPAARGASAGGGGPGHLVGLRRGGLAV